ncbi:MAG: GNAT family N-acetyltransferase [Pseudomonadota bacterium]
MSPEIRPATTPEEIARCLALRTDVFIAEQGVSLAEEQDGLDGESTHWIAALGPRTLATARLREVSVPDLGRAAKLQRVAVARAARGTGLGARFLHAILASVDGPVVLDSQTSALGFYERLGFEAEGPEFLDAGIPHRHMRRLPG